MGHPFFSGSDPLLRVLYNDSVSVFNEEARQKVKNKDSLSSTGRVGIIEGPGTFDNTLPFP